MILKWGVLGTAKINLKVIPFLQTCPDQKVLAIASRTLARAEEQASQLQIPVAYGSYEEVVTSKDVEAVYISLPNDSHHHWAKIALRNGKHVLCEKPMVLHSREAQDLADMAKTNGLLLMEGFMYRHHKQIHRLHEILQSGQLGEIQNVRCSFHFTIPEGPNIRLNPNNGGGVLGDLGCYITDLTNFVYGRAPQQVFANAIFKNGVDYSVTAMMNYGTGQSATFDCSFQGVRRNTMEVVGAKGILYFERPFKGGPEENLKLQTADGVQILQVQDALDPFQSQFRNFANAVKNNSQGYVTNQQSIDTARTLEALLKSAQTGKLQDIHTSTKGI